MESALTLIDRIYDYVIMYTVRMIRAYTDAYKKQGGTDHVLVDDEKESVLHVKPETAQSEEEPGPQSFRSLSEIISTTAHTLTDTASIDRTYSVPAHNIIMYAGTVAVPLFSNPTIAFDSQIATIPYGDLVMMHEPQGRFYKVLWNGKDGWVLKDDLVDRTLGVHPQFRVGGENLIDHSNTAYVRTIINDIFGLSRSEFPLQAGEYIVYRLWKKGLRIAWPETRPRVPGVWHSILKGVPGIHIGVIPKAGSVMEYILEGDIGHLAFVEAVFPDETISLSEVNYPDSGIYNERELTRDMWRELRPVFITVQTSLQSAINNKP